MHHSRIRNTKIVKPLPSSKKAKNEDAESKTGSVSSKMAIIEDARQQKKEPPRRATPIILQKRLSGNTPLYHPSAFVSRISSKKEVFQPHLPVRLPCYDLAPITCFALGRSFRSRTSGAPDFHGLTGGVYKARERIHRAMADARLLANPASRSRVADSDPD